MSIQVSFAKLPAEVVRRGGGFLLSSVMDSRPHVIHVPFQVAAANGQVELRARAGNTARHNCAQRPSVTVLFPAVPDSAASHAASHPGPAVDDELPGDHSLIVDGEARPDPDGEHLIITVVNAVLHRPAPNLETHSADAQNDAGRR